MSSKVLKEKGPISTDGHRGDRNSRLLLAAALWQKENRMMSYIVLTA